jgi:hypothetical protein
MLTVIICSWLRRLYWQNDTFKSTTNFDHIKTHYYWSHTQVCFSVFIARLELGELTGLPKRRSIRLELSPLAPFHTLSHWKPDFCELSSGYGPQISCSSESNRRRLVKVFLCIS